ncbi:9676_t:CDS:1, partial [Funneliformis geosporum]
MSVKVLKDKVILEHAGSSVESTLSYRALSSICCELTNCSSSSVYFYGATVTSWNYRGKELLFL